MTSVPQQQPSPSKFVELSENECIKLLADHTAGRIGFMGLDGPQILPVTYQYRFGSANFVPLLSEPFPDWRAEPASPSRSTGLMSGTSRAGAFWYSDSPKKWSITVCSPPHGK